MDAYLIELLINVDLVLLIQIEGLQCELISEFLNCGEDLRSRRGKRSEETLRDNST